MVSDPYSLLGLSRNASQDDIRQAYRALARRFHPDVNRDPEAAERFKEMGQAFAVLSDVDKRALYDEFGEEALYLGFDPASARRRRQQAARPDRPTGPMPREDGPAPRGPGARGPERQDRPPPHPPVHEADVVSPLEIDLPLALRGGEIRIPSPVGGATLTVRVPPGATSGTRIRVPGRGRPGRRGGRPGDLFLEVVVARHPFFERSGDDLLLELPVTVEEAHRGAEVQIPTLDGWLRIRVPQGSRGGERLRLTGKGVLSASGNRGDMFVHLCVRLPERLAAATRSLDQISRLYSDGVRKGLKL